MARRMNKSGVRHMMVSVAVTPHYKKLVELLAMEKDVTAGSLWADAMEKTYGKRLREIENRFFFADSGSDNYHTEG